MSGERRRPRTRLTGHQPPALCREIEPGEEGRAGRVRPDLVDVVEHQAHLAGRQSPQVAGQQGAQGVGVELARLVDLGQVGAEGIGQPGGQAAGIVVAGPTPEPAIDAARRQPWRQQEWPTILRAAERRKGLILFEDEASCAQWGSLSYTWARRGQQPEVKTSRAFRKSVTSCKRFGACEKFDLGSKAE